MTQALSLLLLFNCFISKGKAKSVAVTYCAIMITTALFIEFVPSDYWGVMYIGTALAELIVIYAISNTNDRVVLPLMLLCFVSIWLNLYGFILWVSYLPPGIYNAGQIILNIAVTLLFLARRQADDGSVSIDSVGRSWVYSHIVTSLDAYKKEGVAK